MENGSTNKTAPVLILGASGFVGSRLTAELAKQGVPLRLLVRNPARAASRIPEGPNIEVIKGDVVENQGLDQALDGVETAYYLIHSMGGRSIFSNPAYAQKDKKAAQNFMDAAESKGLKRVIYLGALGETGKDLSHHLRSRAQVADILSLSMTVQATILRAAIIIGAGGASFEMLRYLVERLPVMGCPKWIETRIQPIALRDVLAYLVGVLSHPETSGKTFDIGGPDILSYREMMQQYAGARGLAPRIIFRVPFLTPLLSAYWVDLVTPIPSGVAHPLIEGLRNEVVCRDNRIQDMIPVPLTPFTEAVKIAFSEETGGPGITGY